MATTQAARPVTSALPGRLVAGSIGGLVGGLAFGIQMQDMGVMPMVAMLVGSTSVAVGWLLHLAISAFLGALFTLLVGRFMQAPTSGVWAAAGVAYGAMWWLLGPLLLMPAKLGMPTFVINAMSWKSLLGHLVYGLLLGIVVAVVAPLLHRD